MLDLSIYQLTCALIVVVRCQNKFCVRSIDLVRISNCKTLYNL